MQVSILSANSMGMVQDAPNGILPLEAWTTLRNVRVIDGKLERMGGAETIGLTSADALQIFPFRPYNRPQALFIAKAAAVYYTEGGPEDDVTGVSGPYTATANDWTYTVLNAIPVLNNGTDIPQAADALPVVALVDIPGWPVGWKAKSIRAYKNLLFALNITDGGTAQPYRYAWSNLADPGTLPADWDIADPSSVAGADSLAETDGEIVDGESLNSYFMIYKDYSAYRLTLGGNNIFNVQLAFPKGLLARNCVAMIPLKGGRHFCVGRDSIYLTDGLNYEEVLDKRLRRWFYDQLETSLHDLTYVVHDSEHREVRVYYAASGASSIDSVLIYNYVDNSVWLADINAAIATCGEFNIAEEATFTWADDVGVPWTADHRRWIELPNNSLKARMVGINNADQLIFLEGGAPDATATIERVGLSVSGKDYRGQITYDANAVKQLNVVWPKVSSPDGTTTLQVTPGSQTVIDGTVTWGVAKTYDPTSKTYVNVHSKGRLLAIKFESVDDVQWALDGYDIDLVKVGK